MALLQENGQGNIPWIKGQIIMEYPTEDMAKAIFESIEVDNYQYVNCRVERNKIICEAKAEKASKLLHTLDDLLACIIVSEEVYRTS
jgi:tRNA threonylcarbamoyladenosine modification (KEOPS) complex  Pcc1 subunit